MTTIDLSLEAQICDHMAIELNQSGFMETLRAKPETDKASMSGPYGTVTRTYLPEYEHEFPQEYRVSIYPEATVQTRNNRGGFREDYQIMMVVFKKIDISEDRSTITRQGDRVLKLAQEIRKWFEREGPDAAQIKDGVEICECARWLGVLRPSIYEMAELSELHVLFSAMAHRWMTIRELAICGSEI